MYYPKLRPQLNGHRLEAVNCGRKATQMAIDWLSKGKIVPNIDRISEVMGDDEGGTTFQGWDQAIDVLGGRTLGFRGQTTIDWSAVRHHLKNDGAAIVAVDYGVYRRRAPAKVGSLTFSGYHAILFVNTRRRRNTTQTRSFDSLLDGRYRGCPNGPVWVNLNDVRVSAEAVGLQERGNKTVYAVLLHRDADIGGEDIEDEPDGDTLIDIISDLYAENGGEITPAIEALERLIGATVVSDADEDTPVVSGIKL